MSLNFWKWLAGSLVVIGGLFLAKRYNNQTESVLMHDNDQTSFNERAAELGMSRTQLALRFAKNWFLERLAATLPVPTWRATCHRWRGINIGKNVYIGYEVLFDRVYPDLITIEDYAEIGDRCIINAHSHSRNDTYEKKVEAVLIKTGAWVLPGVIIVPGVTIGERAIVGAGAVVREDVPAQSLVMGRPNKVIPMVNA